MEENKCDVGTYGSDHNCHKQSYTRKSGLKDFDELTDENQNLVAWRAALREQQDQIRTICHHHEQLYLVRFPKNHQHCRNPFNKHAPSKTKKTKGQILVSLEMTSQFLSLEKEVIPGWKICRTCQKELEDNQQQPDNTEDETSSQDDNSCVSDCEQAVEFEIDAKRQKIDESFDSLGVSPVHLKGVKQSQRQKYVEKKTNQVRTALVDQFTDILGTSDHPEQTSADPKHDKLVLQKASDLDRLMDLCKERIPTVSRREKIQVLTLVPDSWSKKETVEFFRVTDYMVRQARTLKSEKGILSLPAPKHGRPLPQETVLLVTQFYEDDMNSRCLPGKKDFISVKGEHKQKRLILINLAEMYAEFKKVNPGIKIGLSKFCSLKPKWCVYAGASGTHSVCVCTHHQNAKLLVDAISWELDYKTLMGKVVCDTENNMCMVHRCPKCPGKEALLSFLKNEIEMEDEDEMYINQWQTTDRATMITQTVTFEEYRELLATAIDNLTTHSYIAKCQGKYLKDLKESLNPGHCLALGDFAENYKYIIQDEIQSFHWTSDSCTLHPVVLYYKLPGNDELKHLSYCLVSDDLEHDVTFVYKVQEFITSDIKTRFSHIKKVIYFSDGCGGQYKNCKNFLNLCLHQSDFGLDAEWVFFATSHGKSPCDGIGGTVKRQLARTSLQRPKDNQILSEKSVMDFCTTNLLSIVFHEITVEELDAKRTEFENSRYARATTVDGTRSYHHFVPVSSHQISFKKTSEDAKFTGTYSFALGSMTAPKKSFQVGNYIACMYDNLWWIGLIEDISEVENRDVGVKFFHPHGPARSFSWPSRRDYCCVPFNNVLTTVSSPNTSSTGRVYHITDKEYDDIEKLYHSINV